MNPDAQMIATALKSLAGEISNKNEATTDLACMNKIPVVNLGNQQHVLFYYFCITLYQGFVKNVQRATQSSNGLVVGSHIFSLSLYGSNE